jgi:hypothetical protein
MLVILDTLLALYALGRFALFWSHNLHYYSRNIQKDKLRDHSCGLRKTSKKNSRPATVWLAQGTVVMSELLKTT